MTDKIFSILFGVLVIIGLLGSCFISYVMGRDNSKIVEKVKEITVKEIATTTEYITTTNTVTRFIKNECPKCQEMSECPADRTTEISQMEETILQLNNAIRLLQKDLADINK